MTRPSTRLAACLLASLALSACSQSPDLAETNPYANGADYPWSYTRPDGQLSAQTLTPGDNTLYYEPILSATNGWGPLEINRSNGEQGATDGKALTLNGKTYSKGLGVHAGSDVRYSLKGTGASCVRFTADIGVDDEVGSRGSVVFQIYLDGVKAYDSGVMTGSSATKQPGVDITGKQELRLVVTDAGDNKFFDHADWANPTVTCVASAQPTLTLGQSSVEIFHKRSATVNATFENISGPVTLRLVPPADFSPGGNAPGGVRPIVLQTTAATLDSAGSTVPLNLSAPGLPAYRNEITEEEGRLSYTYTLIASQNGQDIASASLPITEGLLTLQAGVELPDGPLQSGVAGTVVMTMKVTPSLDELKPVTLDNVMIGNCDQLSFDISPDGASYLESGLLKQRYTVFCETPSSSTIDVNVGVDDISGYREWWYGNTVTQFSVNAVP